MHAASGGVGLLMASTWFQNNYATLDGGAMHIEATMGITDFTNITITKNHAKSFGGAINEVSSNITFRNSAFNYNIADLYGGGIFTFFAGCYIFDSEVVGNTYAHTSTTPKPWRAIIWQLPCTLWIDPE